MSVTSRSPARPPGRSDEACSPPLADAARGPAAPTASAARRRGFSVALVADGAGKTTVARRLAEELPFAASYVYMGSNRRASNWMLPTTWALHQWRRWRGRGDDEGGPPQRRRSAPSGGPLRRTLRAVKSACLLANRLCEQAFRTAVAWFLQRIRGRVVLFDRHDFADYYSFVVAGENRTLLQRVHGLLLRRAFPRPDLVLFLDAPSELLLARKGEGTVELLEHRRQDYLRVAGQFRNFQRIDASGTIAQVTEEAIHRIVAFREDGG